MNKSILKLGLFFLAIFFSLSLFESALLYNLFHLNYLARLVVILLAGVLYTSFLTIPIAIAVFIMAIRFVDPLTVILLGGFGGVLGDLFIIKLFRVLFSEFSTVRHRSKFAFLSRNLRRYKLTPFAFIVGVLIIASPLPDELGLLLLGVTKISYPLLIVTTLFANTVGIFLLLLPILLIQ